MGNPYGENNEPFQKDGQSYGQPPAGQPEYGQPYGQPQYGQPYGQPQYGQPAGYPGGYGAPSGPAPDNYLVWAILATVLCCLPLGIVSIIKSNSVNTLWAQGQYAAAQTASEDARKFALWSAIAGVASLVLLIIFYVVVFAAALSSS